MDAFKLLNKLSDKFTLTLILLIGLVLRFLWLGDFPALNADEAAIGYNAYSLVETGKDEHGNPWPIHFQSFNDYKPGLYFYLVLPFVKLFGLSEWSVRLPNAFLGFITIYLVYILVLELFGKIKFDHSFRNPKLIALLSALFLAISPWHIHFSRGGWEVNVATFFITLGTYLFVKYSNSEDSRFEANLPILFLSILSFSLSLYAYHAARIIVPLQFVGLMGIYFNKLRTNVRNLLLAGLLGIVAVLPLAKDLIRPEISSRAAGVGILADTGPYERVNEQRGEHDDFNSIVSKIIHNKFTNYSLRFFQNYAEHFHGLFLFLSGDDIQRNKVPETGQMYLFDLVLVLVGIWLLAKTWNKPARVILHWLLIAPIAAALTFQAPHALRAQNMVIPLVIIAALGISKILSLLPKINYILRFFCYLLLTVISVWQFARYLHMYYRHMFVEYPYSSQYGVKELVQYLDENRKGKNVVVTTRYDQPYILFLFYNSMLNPDKFPPSEFQKDHVLTERDIYGFSTVSGYNTYVFKRIDWDRDRVEFTNSIIVGTPEEIPNEANIIKRIYGINGFEYFNAVAN